jgi:hypothetical protein
MLRRLLQPVIMLTAILALAGCAGSNQPIFGDWRGRQPTGIGLYPSFVDLVLYGQPGDVQGEYDYQANRMEPTLFGGGGNSNLAWGDHWTLTPSKDPSVQILHLHNLPSSQISAYALMPNHVLIPVTPAGVPDMSPGSLSYALTPVPRTNRSYGRL